ncbi:MAG: SUMF1/EgtB/PvdO family nonheme iron enzyme [Candidatus Riflebacteria bacterium]|nr:SUMF1/EgtB/PvdO family nonheme iron enzyme [Candidatus Riflebacteria bacterium]
MKALLRQAGFGGKEKTGQPKDRPAQPPASQPAPAPPEPGPPERSRAPLVAGAVVVLALVVGLYAFSRPSPKPRRSPKPVVRYVEAPDPTPQATQATSVELTRTTTRIPDGDAFLSVEEGEETTRPVTGFRIDLNEVTNADFARFASAAGYRAKGDWVRYAPAGRERHPVRNITWDDAEAYCKWAGKRLPTSLEWEYAARGTDGRPFPWGSQKPEEGPFVPGVRNDTSPVGSRPAGASPFGVLDMTGNVWEWTADRDGKSAVVRGGAYSTDPVQLPLGQARETRTTFRPAPDCGCRCAADGP